MSNTKLKYPIRIFSLLLVAGLLVAAGYFTRSHWTHLLPTFGQPVAETHAPPSPALPETEVSTVRMSEQACANLGLQIAPCKLKTYWRTIQTTGMIIDRPGFTDRGITSPINCVVAKVHAYEGDIVRPGEKLFTLRLISEYLQQTQSDLFKALSEIQILKTEIARISKLANSGVIPEKRVIKLQQDIKRQRVQIETLRQELTSRGLDETQIKKIERGEFIRSIDVVAPDAKSAPSSAGDDALASAGGLDSGLKDQRDSYLEIQELKVELGQQVKSGELLAVLANHNYLYINGHAFKKEAGNIAKAAELEWDVEVEFIEDSSDGWEPLDQTFQVRHLANTIDVNSRTFDFFVPLTNQSRDYQREGKTFVVWRFRPGQRVRVNIPVEKMEDVIVLPNAAVISDGPESFVFQQNGDIYNRIAVHVLHQDRRNTVIANDGSLLPGFAVANNSAASLNRVLKVQSASGENAGNFHVHADGTVHANH